MIYDVIVLAAGKGKRMGAEKNKMLLELNEVPIIVHTLLTFERDAACTKIVLVINDNEKAIFHSLILRFNLNKVEHVVKGGSERQESVFQGLQVLKGDGIVLIHDGARPLVTAANIAEVVKEAENHGAAILAVPVKDTIKKVVEYKVKETIDRSSLWAVQTPQAFRLSLILKAHQIGREQKITATDDASLMEYIGWTVAVVEGDYRNIKMTTPDDMAVAEQFLLERGCDS